MYEGEMIMEPINVLKERIRNIKIDAEYLLKSDYIYNNQEFKKRFGREPSLDNPVTFSEKLLYLKMYYDDLLENVCADKHTVNEYVRQCGYPEIVKDIYQVCFSPDQIDLNLMPSRFFIQCSHSQGRNYVVSKDDPHTIEKILKLYKVLLRRKHYKVMRENCYKYITPRIICSEYLEEPGRETLTDYKFYCFSGEVKYFMVSYGEFNHQVKNHKFDPEWNSIDYLFKKEPAIPADMIKKPENFDKMLEIATKLSNPFPHVRVDLYNISGRIVFGEMTFYSAGGFVRIASPEMDKKIGSWIDLNRYADRIKNKGSR